MCTYIFDAQAGPAGNKPVEYQFAAPQNSHSNNETPLEMAPLRGDSLGQFFQQTEVISGKIQQFQANINEVDQLFTQNLNARLDSEELTESNRQVKTKEEFDRRKLRTSTLSKQFKDALSRFQNVQYQHGQKSKETVARQYRIANPSATEEDIRRLVDEDQGGIFTQQLLQQARGQQAMAALSNVQSRQRELHQLQESIVELAQLFEQLGHLISDQDVMFQYIEESVLRSESDIEKGRIDVGHALQHGIAARKPFISSTPLSQTSPHARINYVHPHEPSPTKDGLLFPRQVRPAADSASGVLSLPVLSLSDSDFDFWLKGNDDLPLLSSSSDISALCLNASSVSTTVPASTHAHAHAHALASASAVSPSQDCSSSGFDQMSLLDEICASAISTPDQTPSQTPLIDCVASDDLDFANLDLFWTTSSPASTVLPEHASPALQQETYARLQAENALLDFVLFDDIAPPSPISTPMTASLTSPSVDTKEIETPELTLLVDPTASSSTSTFKSQPSANDATNIFGSPFSDAASLSSPVSDTTAFSTPAVSPFSPPQLFAPSATQPVHVQDLTSTSLNQSFLFDFGVTNGLFPPQAFSSLSSTEMVNNTTTAPTLSPLVDLNLLLSLYTQQATALVPLSTAVAGVLSSASTVPSTTNPLKRKSDEIQQASSAGEDSNLRQFVCAQCGRAFSRLFNLNTHERTHDRSKARLFACPEQGCKKSFTRKNDLQRHQVSIHKVTHIYSCKTCNSPFQRKDALRRHMDEKSCVAPNAVEFNGDHDNDHDHDHDNHHQH
ncbi:Plasma membrane t-SNARE, secretory vesicle fusion [Podila humilis]|nr:Plasma membrane t-SNARE, secretory vesicle fusion [Podila humilis]